MTKVIATSPNDRTSTLATWLFIAPMFLQRAFIGGEGDSYSDYTGFSLFFVGYFANFGLLALAIFRARSIATRYVKPMLLMLALASVSLFQIAITATVTDINVTELLLPLGRGWLWLLAVYAYTFFFFQKEIFVNALVIACRFASYVSVIIFIVYSISNVPLGIHIANGYPRVQGLFSEPSALSALLPAAFLYSIFQRRWLDALLSFAAISLSGSVIVYLTLGFSTIVVLAYRLKLKTMGAMLIYGYCGLVAIAPLILTPENSLVISDFSAKLIDTFGVDNFDGSLFEIFLGRVLLSLESLSNTLSNYSVNSVGGSLARLIGSFITIDDLRSNGLAFVGYGLNIYGYISVEKYGDIFDFGYYPFLISSFGIAFALVALIVLVRKVNSIATDLSGIGIFLIGGVFSTLINSAGGIHMYALPTLAILWALFPRSMPRKEFK